jgi:hypothetical protein
METVAQRVDRLEQVMIELAEQSKITQREVARLSTEMLEFKDEMREFKREMNKRWGELAGLDKVDFIKLLGKYRVSIFSLSEEELVKDIENA